MKKIKNFIVVLVPCLVLLAIWQNGLNGREEVANRDFRSYSQNFVAPRTSKTESYTSANADRFSRDAKAVDYSGVLYTPWDVENASAKVNSRETKPYTIMVYMNGSDLESESGAATIDILEMMESGVNSDILNLVIFTGGTNRWQNDVIPENECMIWEIIEDQISEITGAGLVNMGNSGTLASFLDFSIKNFPAEKYGLILWDHGGGSIAGYGHDEKFNNSRLSLLDLNYAFERSPLTKNKIEFLGFDSCLMATVEMAVVASDYAKYLIASEDLTPGDGWDYRFLSELNNNPYMDGATLGVAITDYFMNFYGANADEDLNMSVIGLSNVNEIMFSMGKLMEQCSVSLLNDRVSSFRTLAQKRNGTKTFGLGSPRDNESDMVDIGDMAYNLSDMFPNEAADIISSLDKSVLYNRNNSDIYLSGLSSYYIYGGKDTAKESLGVYATLNMDSRYTGYLNEFFSLLSNNNLIRPNTKSRSSGKEDVLYNKENLISVDFTMWQPTEEGRFIMTGIKNDVDIDSDKQIYEIANGLWPQINGKGVCLYKISGSSSHSLYAIPTVRNGRDCDIIVLISEKYPEGKILGARIEDGFVIQKGYDEIKVGDKIAFYYQENNSAESYGWYKSEEFTVNGELKINWSKINSDNVYYSLLYTDFQNNKHFTGLRKIPVS